MKQRYITVLLALIIMFLGVFTISQNWKMMDYDTLIDNLSNKLNDAEDKLFNLGDVLLNKQHVYDLKFIVSNDGNDGNDGNDNNDIKHEFYAHKYILMPNSKYFKELLLNETDEDMKIITYTDISKNDFNSVMELIYSGKFKTSVTLNQLSSILEYINKFLIFEKHSDYIDSYFASKFNKYHNETLDVVNVALVSNVYDIACMNNLHNLKNAILRNIYDNWKFQLLNEQHVANHSTLFYDYIRLMNCANNRVLFD